MAEVKYKVPLVAQAKSMSCWYAAAAMIGYTYEAGPRLGLPKVWIANTGITVAQVKELGKVEHMAIMNSASHDFDGASLVAALSKNGPIWAAGFWYGGAHAIVITGADDSGDGTVYLNDPDGGVAKTGEIKWFNEKRIRGTMMSRGYPPKTKA